MGSEAPGSPELLQSLILWGCFDGVFEGHQQVCIGDHVGTGLRSSRLQISGSRAGVQAGFRTR